MARQLKDFTYDNSTLLKDAGLVASTAAAQVAGSNKILDMGASRFDGRAIIDFTAAEADTNDEIYHACIQGSTSATFASGIVNLGVALLGDATTTHETVDTAVGRREIAFCNEVNGTVYRYVRAYTYVAGTVATGINYTAFIAQKV